MKIDSNTNPNEVKETTELRLKNIAFIKKSDSKKSTLNDAIKKMMRLNTSRVPFSDYDFIRLFLAYVKIDGNVFINRDNLRYDLYEYYKKEEYKVLFQDIVVKQQIEENFLDIEEALQNAVLYGLLDPHDCNLNSPKRIILLNEDECYSIITKYDEIYTEKMEKLTGEFLDNKCTQRNEKYHYDGKVKQLQLKKIKNNNTN